MYCVLHKVSDIIGAATLADQISNNDTSDRGITIQEAMLRNLKLRRGLSAWLIGNFAHDTFFIKF